MCGRYAQKSAQELLAEWFEMDFEQMRWAPTWNAAPQSFQPVVRLNPETGVNSELRRIAEQETIDSVSVDSGEEAEFFAQLLECDESLERDGRASLDAWVTKRLLFDYQRLEPEIGRYIHNGECTLVPVFDAFGVFEESIDRESSLGRRRHEMPLIPTLPLLLATMLPGFAPFPSP